MSAANQMSVISGISQEIWEARIALEEERYFPGFNPDKMDEKIKRYNDRVSRLLHIRNELEEEFTTPILARD
jgi:hypothetical protein